MAHNYSAQRDMHKQIIGEEREGENVSLKDN